jgi:hypothetical protein
MTYIMYKLEPTWLSKSKALTLFVLISSNLAPGFEGRIRTLITSAIQTNELPYTLMIAPHVGIKTNTFLAIPNRQLARPQFRRGHNSLHTQWTFVRLKSSNQFSASTGSAWEQVYFHLKACPSELDHLAWGLSSSLIRSL